MERDKISRDKKERAYFDPSRVCKLDPRLKNKILISTLHTSKR